MHRNTKRLAAALLAAVLCTAAAVPQAAAEPWTYEVDDVMASYGVEYYPDVGFENPRRTADEGQSAGSGTDTAGSVDTYSGDTTKAVVSAPTAATHGVIAYGDADDGISAYSDAGQTVAVDAGTAAGTGHEVSVYSTGGFNVYTATNNTYTDTDYTVTIPAEVPVNTTTNKGSFTITTKLKQCCNLAIQISSQTNGAFETGNKGKLTCDTQELPYKISDTKLVFWKNEDVEDETSDSYTVDIQVLDTTIISGTYTDNLTFELTPQNYTNETTGKHLLTFDTNAGNDAVTISTHKKFVKNGEEYGMLPVPKRDFYTFAGWYTAASGGEPVTDETRAGTADTTVYAHWTPHTLTILYHNDGAVLIYWGGNPTYKNRAYKGASYYYDGNGWIYLTGSKVEGINTEITLQEIETYGEEFSNGKTGLFDAWRWKKYIDGRQMEGGSYWTVKENGIQRDYGDREGWTVADCAKALGVLEDLKQDDVTVNLYPTWISDSNTQWPKIEETSSQTGVDDMVILLPSLDETTPVIVDVPTVDTAADEPAATPDSTEPADIVPTAPAADAPADVPETTPDELMIWDAADFRLPQEEWDDWT